MSFFRAGYLVQYVDIFAPTRVGKSHINLYNDGIVFLLIIFQIGTLYHPLKLFLPFSLVHFSSGLIYYVFTYMSDNRFTNMELLLFLAVVVIFLIGLIYEQITTLAYGLFISKAIRIDQNNVV